MESVWNALKLGFYNFGKSDQSCYMHKHINFDYSSLWIKTDSEKNLKHQLKIT